MSLGNINLNALSISAALMAMQALAGPGIAASTSVGFTEVTNSAATTLLAQAENCRQVSSTVGGLTVRTEPSIYASSVGVVPDGRNVTIQNLGTDGWVPIIAPLEGYVSAEYLTGCNLTLPAQEPALRVTDTCRMVVARGGLNVRNEPSIEASRIGGLQEGSMVTIEGAPADGWVKVAEPFSGYVAANYLTTCN